MDLKIRFRFNKATGEVEFFDLEDEGGQRLPDAEHNRIHDRAAAELGNVIERNPRIIELIPGQPVREVKTEPEPETGESVSEKRPDRNTRKREQ